MCTEIRDIRRKIDRLEDDLLRSKDFQEQLKIRDILYGYRKKLQNLMYKQD